MGEAMSRPDERRIKAFLSGNDGDLDEPWDGRDETEAALAAAMEAIDYWRERVPVDDEDLVREKVTVPKFEAWLLSRGWHLQPDDGTSWRAWAKSPNATQDDPSWIDVPRDHADLGVLAVSLRLAASIETHSQWDVLAEVAAMEVER